MALCILTMSSLLNWHKADSQSTNERVTAGIHHIRTAADIHCLDDVFMADLADLSKASFVTLLSDSWNLNYLRAAMVWTHKINELHRDPHIPITVVIESETLTEFGGDAMIKAFKFLGAAQVVTVNNSFQNVHTKRAWQNVYTKLLLWDPTLLPEYRQIAYFDADSLPLQPMYELFTIPCGYILGAVDDVDGKGMNSGFMVIRPDAVVFEALSAVYQDAAGRQSGMLHALTDMREQHMIRHALMSRVRLTWMTG